MPIIIGKEKKWFQLYPIDEMEPMGMNRFTLWFGLKALQ